MKEQNENPNGASPLPTAVEAAMANTEPSRHPNSDAFLTELARKVGPVQRQFDHAALNLNGQRPEFNRRQFIEWIQSSEVSDWFAGGAGWESFRADALEKCPGLELPETPAGLRVIPMFTLVTYNELTSLQSIQKKQDTIAGGMAPFSLSAVNDRMHSMRDAQAARIAAGQDDATQLLPSREAIARDSLARLNVMSAQLVQITQAELFPLARTILQRFDPLVAEFLRKTEVRDREACAIMGIEFHPSLEWKCAAQVAIEFTPENKLPKSGLASATPRQLLGDLIEI